MAVIYRRAGMLPVDLPGRIWCGKEQRFSLRRWWHHGTPTAMSKSVLIFSAVLCVASVSEGASSEHTLKKTQLSDKFWAEGATFGDFNHDGKMDIVAGPVLVLKARSLSSGTNIIRRSIRLTGSWRMARARPSKDSKEH